MSPDEAAFLGAIADNPADEIARLVYADWLADRSPGPDGTGPGTDQARAAFARLSANFLRCLRELADHRGLPLEWAEAMNPLCQLRLVRMSWQHQDGDTVVWRVPAAGTRITAGQLLFELESDRMSDEVRAEESGVVVAALVKPGDHIPFDRPILAYLRLPLAPPG